MGRFRTRRAWRQLEADSLFGRENRARSSDRGLGILVRDRADRDGDTPHPERHELTVTDAPRPEARS